MDRLTQTRLILIEFNELCPHLLDQWMAAGLLPHFSAFFHSSDVFITEADVQDPRYLEPWIQWYSVHTGLSYAQHQVFHLTDGPRAEYADIWQILADHGKVVWNCSSMNARALRRTGALFLPDPWCTTERCFPEEIETFHRVVAHSVQEYTNDKKTLSPGAYLKFATYLARHGLRWKTVAAVATQLAAELAIDRDTNWKRASLLDKLQFDLFQYYFKRYRPDFSTFFVNSTAHYQHSYWRHMEPKAFAVQPPAEEVAKYKDAILFGYQEMDAVLGDFCRLAGDDVMLVLATALSQKPFLKYEHIGGQRFYRPHDVEAFLRRLGVDYVAVQPVMTHQFIVHFADRAAMERGYAALESVTYEGQEVLECSPAEDNSLYFGSQVKVDVPAPAQLTLGEPPQRVPFFDLLYKIENVKSGCHHPDGVLWFRSGQHRVHQEKVSILDIHPTLLEFFNIPTRAVDTTALTGHSLLSCVG